MGFENEASSSSKSLLQSEASSHLNSPKLSSQPKTFANIFIAIVGAGVLGLPYAFKRTGWAAGTLIILFVGALTYHCMMLISRTRLRLLLQPYRMDPSQISSFGDIGLAVAGPAGRLAVDALIVLSHSGYCVGYLIFISNVLSLLLPYPKSLYILAILPFQIALNSVRSLTLLAPLSIFADVIDFAAMAVVLREDFVAGRLDRTDLVWFSGPAEILYGFGVAVFSFEVMGMVLPLESEAADKERFGRTLGLSMGVISLVYAAFGAFGYAAFGDATRDVITSNLGRGKVAVVVQKFVALKIQKSAADFAQAALHEIEVLSAIAKGDPSNCKGVVQLLDSFKHTGPNGQHSCMVFEHLGDSLLRLIRYSRYKGIGLKNVKVICRSILSGLDYLHRELGIIHTDLKPENILLVSTINPAKDPIRSGFTPMLERPEGSINGNYVVSCVEKRLKERAKRARVRISERRASMGGIGQTVLQTERSMEGIDLRCKIVDLGSACWVDKKLSDEIQTRHYRAPEVILGVGYSFPADLWSFACISFELATGDMLFSSKTGQGFTEDEDHLALMMELLGKMPRKVAIGGCRSKDYFDRYGDLKRIRRLKFWPMDRLLLEKYKFSEADARDFSDFLRPLLDFAPEMRPSAGQCLHHPWLHDGNPSAETDGESQNLMAGIGNLRLTAAGM